MRKNEHQYSTPNARDEIAQGEAIGEDVTNSANL
jgi:hypothetical protein